MTRILREAGPGTVIHLATLFTGEHTPEQIPDLLNSNILLGTQLLEAVAATGPVLFINTGTFAQHYSNRDYSPTNLYAATKQAFEAILHYYTESVPLKAVTLKLGDTYGPADKRPKIMKLLLELLSRGGRLEMSPGDQLLDLVHVEDVVAAFIHTMSIAETFRDGELYSYALTSGQPLRLKEVVAAFEKAAGRSLDIGWGSRPYRDREMMEPWTGGISLPGWCPAIPLADGINELMEDKKTAHDPTNHEPGY
jgi:nucleoside-diphosphate-sugar epimerase